MPRGLWLLHGAHIPYLLPSHDPTLLPAFPSPLLSSPQDKPPCELEEFLSPGNIHPISPGTSPPSHRAPFHSCKAPHGVQGASARTLTLPIQGCKLQFLKTSPKKAWAWPGPTNHPICVPSSPFITSLADSAMGQCSAFLGWE